MLLQLITTHPEALGTIVRNTPPWVGGVFAGLLLLGLSQLRDRKAGLARVAITPLAMTSFAVWGLFSAFANAPHFAQVLLAWAAAAITVLALVAQGKATAAYDRASRSYQVAGSWVPLGLILGIFLVKYAVGVELALQPQLVRDSQFALAISLVYGVFSGLFAGRAIRLLRLALRPASTPLAA